MMISTSSTIVFDPLLTEHYPLLLHWLQTPHVKEWWDDGDDTLEKVAQHYAPEPGVERYVIGYQFHEARNADPIGYIQSYPVEDGGRGIDLFLGEENVLNRGIGTLVLRAFLEQLIARHHPSYVLVDPHPDNLRAIRCYEKAGFSHVETTLGSDGKSAYLMRL